MCTPCLECVIEPCLDLCHLENFNCFDCVTCLDSNEETPCDEMCGECRPCGECAYPMLFGHDDHHDNHTHHDDHHDDHKDEEWVHVTNCRCKGMNPAHCECWDHWEPEHHDHHDPCEAECWNDDGDCRDCAACMEDDDTLCDEHMEGWCKDNCVDCLMCSVSPCAPECHVGLEGEDRSCLECLGCGEEDGHCPDFCDDDALCGACEGCVMD